MGKFLKRWTVTLDSEQYSSFLLKAVTCVYEAIISFDMDLEKTFKLFDQDGDGTVDVKEVRRASTAGQLAAPSDQAANMEKQAIEKLKAGGPKYECVGCSA